MSVYTSYKTGKAATKRKRDPNQQIIDESFRKIQKRKIRKQHDVDLSNENDIDLNDIEIPLVGIAIGKHHHFWSCKAYDLQPKILINKHQNCIDLYLESIHGDYVSVSIKTTQIESLYIPENPSFFDLNDLNLNPSSIDEVDKAVTPYLQVIFIQTKKKLSIYQWLSKYYDPKNINDPGIERITLIIDGYDGFNTFKQTVLNQNLFHELTNVVQNIQNDEKSLWLSNLKFKRGVKPKWRRFDTEKTKKCINKLLIMKQQTIHENEEDIDYNKLNDKYNVLQTLHESTKKELKQKLKDFTQRNETLLTENNNKIKQLNEQLLSMKAIINDYKHKNEGFKKNVDALQQRLDLYECKPFKLKTLNLEQLHSLKDEIQNKIKKIDETERELIDNTYKCVVCMDRPKNMSFLDGCNHIAICYQCELKLVTKKCPLCKTPYTNVRKMNI